MYFTENEVDLMRTILRRLEPETIESVQYFTPENEMRTCCTMQILNKYNKPICILQNYTKLTPYRKKLLLRLSKQLPYEIHITQPREDITRIGWKYQK